MEDYIYFKKALAHVAKPCAFLHMNALERNIQTIIDRAGDKKIRVASKSIRSVDVLHTIFSSSDVFQGIMCFTAEEALFLYGKGFDDLLVAYPVWDEQQLKAVCQAVKKGATITLMVDHLEHVERLEKIAAAENGTFLVCLELDLSMRLPGLHFGVHRSPMHDAASIVTLAKRVKQSAHLTLDGIMGYEAQIAGVTDDDPNQKLKNRLVAALKKRSIKQVAQRRKDVMYGLREAGISLRFVNGGGTGSLHVTTKEESITEVTVGSGFFNSHLFDKYSAFQFEAAAGFAIEITRKPTESIFTCFGGGYVASGAVGKDKLPEVFLPHGAKLTKNEGVGEVQTPVKYIGEIPLQLGDPIFFRHSKAGELCERFQYLYVIKNGNIADTFSTYRGDGQCFL